MFHLGIGFDKPWYLLLLVLVPLLWIFSFRSLAGLGRWRRLLAISVRTLVFAVLVFALAEVQLRRGSDRVTVIYLLDQSESIPEAKRELMVDYVVQEVKKHRRKDREDRAGIIVFGRDAAIEIPPFDDDIPNLSGIESYLDRTDATNLEAAMKLAQASFPEDTAKRIVIVTDGNENVGNARTIAPVLSDNQIGIDVVPVVFGRKHEIEVEKLTLPADVRRGQPTEVRVVLNNYTEATEEQPGGVVKGKLRVVRQMGQREELLVPEQEIELEPGKKVLSFQHKIDQPGAYTYKALFTPDDPNDDLMVQNNVATAFTHVRGKGRVLWIKDWQSDSKESALRDSVIRRLQELDIEVDVQGSDQLFTGLAELQAYDTIVLDNVPRSSGDDAKEVTSFSDDQIEMLVRNTEQMGCGLIMTGGQSAFGAGGWSNTGLEKAMPVDFQIKNAKVQAVGALVLMMHASELAQGNYWQKVVALEALDALGPMDYCGLIHWDNFAGADAWLWGGREGLIRVSDKRNLMKARLNRMQPGDMPNFAPAMRMALAGFNRVDAAVKQMIIISDGDPGRPPNTLVQSYKDNGIKISTVAIGTHGPPGSTPLQNIATLTGGKYYVVTNPKALPKIYQREARRVARPLVKDLDNVRPLMVYPHEMLEGIDGPLPPLKGFVLTTLKDSPLVELSIVSPDPPERQNSTILASWTYGAGRTAVFTTDTGTRWADEWTNWENYDKFFSQMIRWTMRPVNEEGKFAVATDVRDGKVRVVVRALDENDEFLNFLNMGASATGPDMKPFAFPIHQVAPGRYVGEFDASKSGSYHLSIIPGDETGPDGRTRSRAPIRAGVDVPYSSEFRHRETNQALLTTLAGQRPKGGDVGSVIEGGLVPESLNETLAFDTFRHDNLPYAISIQDVWPLFVLVCAVAFFTDVFVRRVTFSYDWIQPGVDWVREKVFRKRRHETVDQALERLRSRKAAVRGQLDERRAAARFEPQMDSDAAIEPAQPLDEVLDELAAGPSRAAGPPSRAAELAPGEAERDDSYTSRLLQAKKRAWKDDKHREP